MDDIFSKFRAQRAKSRILLWATLAIILIRGLLSNVVMFDVHSFDGGFGLVMCSGSGPIFPAINMAKMSSEDAGTNGDAQFGKMPGMLMDDMSMSSPTSFHASDSNTSSKDFASSGHQNSMNMGGPTQGDGAICPFSAALFAATITLVVFVFFSVTSVRRKRFRQGRHTIVAFVTPYRLALTRAPPLFLGR